MGSHWKRSPVRIRTALVVGLVVVTAGGAGWWFLGRDTSLVEPTVTTVQASTTTLEKTVESSGTLSPTVEESVSFTVGGTVTAVSVSDGDTVAAGQILATIDTLELNAALLEVKATLAQAEAKLGDLEDSADGSDSSDAQIAAAEAKVSVAQTQVNAAEEDLANATLLAPTAGLVTTVDLEVGDKVSGSGGSGGGATTVSTSTSTTGQFTIVGTDAYQVALSLSDADVALIEVGDQVEMTSDDISGTVFGLVSSIGLIATTSADSSGYPVVVDVTDDVSALRDGISVTASVIYERRTGVLTVPSQAINQEDGQAYVEKVESDGTVTKTAVEVGETSGTLTEITSGLSESDSVQVTTYATNSNEGTDTEQSEQSNNQMPGQFPDGQMPDGQAPNGQMPGGQE